MTEVNTMLEAPPANNDDPPKSKKFKPLFLNVKEASLENNATLRFLRKVGIFCSGSVGVTILLGIIFGLQVASIVLGVMHKDNCPAEKYIPIYLIALGAVSVINTPLAVCAQLKSSKDKESPGCIKLISGLIGLFVIAWFIAGSVWVFRIYPPEYEDEESELFCNHTVYMFSFVILLVGYCTLPALCICGCCIGICLAVVNVCLENDN